MIAGSDLLQLPTLLYGVIFATALCLVFGIATLFEPARLAVASLRRATRMNWVATQFSAVFIPTDGRKRYDLQLWLLQAGYDAPNAVETYFGVRVLTALASAALAAVCLPLYPGFPRSLLLSSTLIAAVIGFLAPIYVVRMQRARRQRKFREGLPDVLDLLLICSEAGLGIDTAIMTVGDELREPHPLLADQLQHVSTMLRAGRERKDAMRDFADRTGIEEAVSLVNLLVQSDTLGTSMAQTLRTFSDDMRSHRMLKAEEQGHKIAAKLTVVLVACFLPAIFAALLAPAVFSAIKTMHILGQVHPW